MKNLTKEELINVCRSEKVNDNTIYLFHECEHISVPQCSRYLGEWIWSNDINKLFACYNECVLWGFMAELCCNNEEVTEDKNLIDLINLFGDDNDDSIVLKTIISNTLEIKSIKEFKYYVEKTTEIVQKLGLECDTCVCINFNQVIDQVEIHNEGIIPHYDTKEEYLLEDGYY